MLVVARAVSVLLCGACAVLAATLGWIGATAASGGAAEVASRAGYAPAVYEQLEALRRDGRPPAELAHINQHLARRAPLSDAPFGFAGLAALEVNDPDRATRLLTEALRRNPRNQVARIWLVNVALEDGSLEAAITHLDVLTRIDPARSAHWGAGLTQVAMLPGGIDTLIAFLDAREGPPPWMGSVVSELNHRSGDIQGLARLNARSPETQAAYLARVVKEQGAEVAYKIWVGLAGARVKEPVSWPFNGRFDFLAAPAPFNWHLRSSLAEIGGTGSLDVSYLGRGSSVLADQLMLVPPGRYRLLTKLSGETSSQGGGLAWELRCHPDGSHLGALAMRDLTLVSETFQVAFEIPEEGCGAQWLQLRGLPGEFPTRARARITEVSISPDSGVRK